MIIDRDQCSFMMVGESEWDWQIVLPLLNTGQGLFKHKVIYKEWKKREGTRHICMISQRALSVDILGCCSVVKSCLTLCDPMDCSTPGFPVLHYLPEFSQAHVHGVGDAIQPPHSLSSLSPPALYLSQHQGFFQ